VNTRVHFLRWKQEIPYASGQRFNATKRRRSHQEATPRMTILTWRGDCLCRDTAMHNVANWSAADM
jgi:hypothetical protein